MVARCEHLAAACDARRPVRETIGRVVRPDGEAVARDEDAVGSEQLDEIALAARLVCAIELEVLRRRLRAVGQRFRRRVLVGCVVGIREDIDRAHERVARARVANRERARAHGVGRIAAHVDDGVGSDVSDLRDIARNVAITAHERRAAREEVGVRRPTVEERDAMARRKRRLDDVSPDEARPAENQQMHDAAFSVRAAWPWHA